MLPSSEGLTDSTVEIVDEAMLGPENAVYVDIAAWKMGRIWLDQAIVNTSHAATRKGPFTDLDGWDQSSNHL